MNFSDKEPLMLKKKSPPTVALQSVFVRDYQRRLRLVIELLEKEARRQQAPPTNLLTAIQEYARQIPRRQVACR